MNLRKRMTGVLAGTGILVLILDSETALSGADAGMNLCIKTVVPSLFPFLFLCGLLTHTLWGGQARYLQKVSRRLGIPQGAESILISAMLGGYPAGAQAIGTAFQNGSLEENDACHLLSFCNNAGPAFLFGMTAAMFPEKTAVWALWLIQIFSGALTAVTGRHIPSHSANLPSSETNLTDLLGRTVRIMATICGWVLLFRIVSAFLHKWILFRFPLPVQVLITGLLELSNGCVSLGLIDSIPLRFLLCSIFLSFGGLCVTMQTLSVIVSLSPVPYLTGKLRQTCFSLLLSAAYLQTGWFVFVFSLIFLCFFRGTAKKKWISCRTGCIIPSSPPGGYQNAVS